MQWNKKRKILFFSFFILLIGFIDESAIEEYYIEEEGTRIESVPYASAFANYQIKQNDSIEWNLGNSSNYRGTLMSCTNEDDGYQILSLGFDFQFFDQTVDQVLVSTNRYFTLPNETVFKALSFTDDFPSDHLSTDYVMSAFWYDLDPGDSGDMYYYNDPGGTYLEIIYWEIEYWEGTDVFGSFQYRIYDTGEVQIKYKGDPDLTIGSRSGVTGINKGDGLNGQNWDINESDEKLLKIYIFIQKDCFSNFEEFFFLL